MDSRLRSKRGMQNELLRRAFINVEGFVHLSPPDLK